LEIRIIFLDHDHITLAILSTLPNFETLVAKLATLAAFAANAVALNVAIAAVHAHAVTAHKAIAVAVIATSINKSCKKGAAALQVSSLQSHHHLNQNESLI
jgi:hypothetical protein